jgi:hypothetical protein
MAQNINIPDVMNYVQKHIIKLRGKIECLGTGLEEDLDLEDG